LALISEHLELLAAIAVFVVWKGPGWGLEVLALEKAWEERRERRAKDPNPPGVCRIFRRIAGRFDDRPAMHDAELHSNKPGVGAPRKESSMNQSQASDACSRMAEAHAARTDSAGDANRVHSRVHKATFDHAFEFIPEEATWAVIDNEDEPPKLMALDGLTLYTLTVGSLEDEYISVPTTCRMDQLDPKTAWVECEVKFLGHRSNAEPMGRHTIWTFGIGANPLRISTMTHPDRNRLQPDELFAQALATALGWETLPREDGITRLKAAA
jgi:hypothetical protein